MAKVTVGMTLSLDGFVADPSGSTDRLYADLCGASRHLFFAGGPERVRLEKIWVQEIDSRTSLTCAINK